MKCQVHCVRDVACFHCSIRRQQPPKKDVLAAACIAVHGLPSRPELSPAAAQTCKCACISRKALGLFERPATAGWLSERGSPEAL